MLFYDTEIEAWGSGYTIEAECLPSKCESLGSITGKGGGEEVII